MQLQPEKTFILTCLKELIDYKSEDLCINDINLKELDWVWLIKQCNEQGLLGFIAIALQKKHLFTFLEPTIQEILKTYLAIYKRSFRYKRADCCKYFQANPS